MQIAMEKKNCWSFLSVCRKKLRQKVLCNGGPGWLKSTVKVYVLNALQIKIGLWWGFVNYMYGAPNLTLQKSCLGG